MRLSFLSNNTSTNYSAEPVGRDADEPKKKEPARLEPGMLLVLDGR